MMAIRNIKFLILFCFILLSLCGIKAETSSFVWRELPALPPASGSEIQAGLTVPFAGISNGVLLVAGGSNFSIKPLAEGGEKQYHDDIYVLHQTGHADAKWKVLNSRFPYRAAYGVSVVTPGGIVCIGGKNASAHLSKVTLMRWDANLREVIFTEMPDLPYTNADMGGALIGNKIYVLGGYVDGKLSAGGVFLDLSNEKAGWQPLPDIPGKARRQLIVAAQNAGDETCLYVFGGHYYDADKDILLTDAYQFIPSQNQWKKLSEIAIEGKTRALAGASAIPMGTGHILFSGGDDQELLAYHTITDTWTNVATVPWQPVVGAAMIQSDNGFILVNGEINSGVSTSKVHRATIKTAGRFGFINYTVLLLYLIGLLLVGAYFMKKNEGGTDDFFRGGQTIPWWAAGISIFATALSSITYLSIPAKAYATDWRMLVFGFSTIIIAPIVVQFYLPYFRKLKVASAYQYLEQRFNRTVRYFASALFSIFMVTRIAIVLFLPSLALNAATGINIYFCILMMGLITIAFCTMGGMKAVIWTDVIQGVVLVLGALIALVYLVAGTKGGLGGLFTITSDAEKLRTFDFTFSWTQPVFWVALIGGIANSLITYTSDQSIVQRYITTKDQNSAARGIWLNAIITIPISIIFFLIGAGLYAFYKSNPKSLDIAMQNQDAILPHFIVTELPVGMAGLLIAAVFTASISTISSNVNSVSTTVTEDFFQQWRSDLSERTRMLIARIAGILVGLIGTGFAIGLATWDIKSLWDQFNVFLGLLTSGLGGLFMMGIFTKRINSRGAMTGLFSSIVILLILRSNTQVSFLLFGFIGLTMSFVIGWVYSYLSEIKYKK